MSNIQSGGMVNVCEYDACNADTSDEAVCNQYNARYPIYHRNTQCTFIAALDMFHGTDWLAISQSPDQQIAEHNLAVASRINSQKMNC